MRRWLIALVVSVPALAGAAPSDSGDNTVWYRITIAGGATIGYSSESIVPTPDGGRDIVDTQRIQVVAPNDRSASAELFSLPGRIDTGARIVRHEDGAGRTVSVASENQSGGLTTTTQATIAGDSAVLTQTGGGAGARNVTLTLPAGIRFDSGDGLLAGWDRTKTPRLECDDFNASAMTVEHVVIEPVPGAAQDVLRKRYHDGTLMSVARLTLDGTGAITVSRQPMFGSDIEIARASREEATAPHAPYELLLSTMMKSPYRILDESLHAHIRYRFAFRDAMAFALPGTGEQRVAADADGATVDICPDCGDGLPTDPAYLADALKPTVWLQSDAPEILALAQDIARDRAASDTRKMDLLRAKTQHLLPKVDFIGHYSALEALKRHGGDCTESAALLAALGRAAGIPTRVVNGLVYSRERYHGVSNVFLPHSWVVAYVDGHWRSFDAALGSFDDTHIALNVNDGDDRSAFAAIQLAGVLEWTAMQEVRTRPAG
ncbi:MAG TPA: transglutaminase domain-containing protein [Rhizomicrobium sp.]|jgi:hypothetical protein|nr:transglutaminase domain-containing protein [Rhizomicrobium sp.]